MEFPTDNNLCTILHLGGDMPALHVAMTTYPKMIPTPTVFNMANQKIALASI